MGVRVLSALAGIPIFLGALVAGGAWWWAFLVLVGGLAGYEMARLLQAGGEPVPVDALAAGIAGLLLAGLWAGWEVSGPILFATGWYALLRGLMRGDWPQGWGRPGATVLAVAYVGIPLLLLYRLRVDASGYPFLWTVVVVTWANDTGAYLVGRWVGKRALAPAVSPKKTVEGTIGGLACSAAAGAGVAMAFGLPLGQWLALGAVLGMAAVAGDLAESSLKRWAGVKDSGRVLPGHGGALDRFDSLFLSAPVGYLAMAWGSRWFGV